MLKDRTIRRISKSVPTLEGAGVRLKRAFGHGEIPLFDPFLMLDDFHSDDPDQYVKGFPWHPHRGIETITYVLHGKVEHEDSLGNKGLISSGDVQWMTAGSGIIHQEMPKIEGDGLLWGFQLWANLPAAHKMMAPRYRDITRSQIPEVVLENGVSIKVICGRINGHAGPVQDIVTEPQYLDITLPPSAEWTHPLEPDHTAIAYTIAGGGFFRRDRKPLSKAVPGASALHWGPEGAISRETVVLFDQGEQIYAATGADPFRFLLMSGRPIGEPIAWQGPIVMNTQKELATAFEEYRNGTFLKHRSPR